MAATGTILAIFDPQVTPMLPIMSIGLLVRDKKSKIDFQDGCHSGHLGFPIKRILPIFDLHVTLMLLPSFELIGLSVQKKQQEALGHGLLT